MLIKNAKIYTMADRIIENGDIYAENGRIKEIGENLNSCATNIIDASGLIALPGFIDAHTHIGPLRPDPISPEKYHLSDRQSPK